MKNQKGITLIALIITIIVMVILAGIIIASAVADGGVIDRAQEAMKENERADVQEIIIGSYVFKVTASTNNLAYMDIGKTGIAIYENLKANGFTVLGAINAKDESGNNIKDENGNDVMTAPIKPGENGEEIIDVKVQGNHGEYEGTVTDKGLEEDLKVVEDEIIIEDTTPPPEPPKEPEEEIPYTFTLNDLGDWKVGTEGWISFDKSTVWEKIGKNLYEDDNYKLNSGQSGNWILIIASTNEDIANGVKVLLQDENELKKNLAITGHVLDDYPNEFLLQVTTTSFEEILTEEVAENKITYEKFMNDYGNAKFYFMTKEEAGVNF